MKNIDLDRARSYFAFDEGVTYLNHASHAPLPLPARAAFERFFDSWQKTAHRHDPESFRIFEAVRGKLAGLVGARRERIGLSPHTTYGMNILASGLGWEKGDNIVISEKEFPASVYPWLRLRDSREAKQSALGGGCDRASGGRDFGGERHGEGRQGLDASRYGGICEHGSDTAGGRDGRQGRGGGGDG